MATTPDCPPAASIAGTMAGLARNYDTIRVSQPRAQMLIVDCGDDRYSIEATTNDGRRLYATGTNREVSELLTRWKWPDGTTMGGIL